MQVEHERAGAGGERAVECRRAREGYFAADTDEPVAAVLGKLEVKRFGEVLNEACSLMACGRGRDGRVWASTWAVLAPPADVLAGMPPAIAGSGHGYLSNAQHLARDFALVFDRALAVALRGLTSAARTSALNCPGR